MAKRYLNNNRIRKLENSKKTNKTFDIDNIIKEKIFSKMIKSVSRNN
ncbi:hypothetical protein [Listeria newyorkensis]|nr:hypothetical protein [Listeria newyorkensis]